jgi:hypothetical protein
VGRFLRAVDLPHVHTSFPTCFPHRRRFFARRKTRGEKGLFTECLFQQRQGHFFRRFLLQRNDAMVYLPQLRRRRPTLKDNKTADEGSDAEKASELFLSGVLPGKVPPLLSNPRHLNPVRVPPRTIPPWSGNTEPRIPPVRGSFFALNRRRIFAIRRRLLFALVVRASSPAFLNKRRLKPASQNKQPTDKYPWASFAT